MPLTEVERREFSDIIGYLSQDDVISLARTILKDQVKVLDAEEAKNAILNYTFNANELFRRKKLKKEALFQYLYDKKVNGVLPSSEKTVLVVKILNYWGSEETFELMEDDDAPDVILPAPMKSLKEGTLQQEMNMLNSWADNSLMPNEMDKEFAAEFCRWFYVLLNGIRSLMDSCPTLNNDHFNKSHFFEDCNMALVIKHLSSVSTSLYQGADEVSSRLLKLIREEGVLFNPNLTDKGIKTLCDAYGRKVIIVAGTVHHTESIGIFEQHFGLVRDPTSDFAWKIKFTRLVFLVNGSSHIMFEPNLEYTRNMLT